MAAERPTPDAPTLARTLGLGALVIYGVGDMLGSGIYALVGKVAGAMGNAVWLAFLVSMVAALLTGLSYASLGSRYPRAAGAAYVTQRAFHRPFLSYVVGLAVMASGLTSMATQSRAFAGYLGGLLQGHQPGVVTSTAPEGFPAWAAVVVFILALTAVNLWGMRESTWLNIVCTTVEVCGLAIVILAGMRYWGSVNYLETPAPVAGAGDGGLGVSMLLSGAVLTFYSFIGFEDMINVIEEVRDPRRVFPRALMLALACATVIYMLVSISAISVLPHAELAASKQPLVDVVRRAWPAFPPTLFSFISLFAITNTALLNYIMGSRLVYGMARQGLVPAALGAVHPRRRTPHVAIGVLMVLALGLALAGDISTLARATSALLLSVFVVVNGALVALKRRPGEPAGSFEVPLAVPIGGMVVCLALLAHAKPAELAVAGTLLGGIVLLYFVMRPREVTEETLAELSADLPE